jgi:hypothetical protein
MPVRRRPNAAAGGHLPVIIRNPAALQRRREAVDSALANPDSSDPLARTLQDAAHGFIRGNER